MAGDDRREFSRSFSVRSNYSRSNTIGPLHSYRRYTSRYVIPEDVTTWRKSLLTTYVEEEEKPQEFQSSLGNIQEYQRIPPFPPPSTDDDLILRRTLDRRNAVARSQTIHVPSGHHLPQTVKKENSLPREIKGLQKIKINGDEKPCKGHTLKIEENKILLVDEKNNKHTVIHNNFIITSQKKIDDKVRELYSSSGETITLKVSNKDADQYSLRKRANSESKPPDSPLDDKKKTRNLLMKFLKRRSSKDVLVRKGILKNEPIFGNLLTNLSESYKVSVPEFITKVIEIIERPYNITSLGVYRASGNLATIQKIRLNVDKHNLKILEEYKKDTDVLTGCLKMFFRELTQPLIPVEVYEKLLKMSETKWTDDIPRKVNPIIENMEEAHRETLKTLMFHLLKVIENQDENKMSMQNMSIVWGPSLIHVPDSTGENLIQNSNNANNVIFLLLKCFTAFQKAKEEEADHVESPQTSALEELDENSVAPKAVEEVYNSREDLTRAHSQNSNYKEKFKQASQKIASVQWLNEGSKKLTSYPSNMSLISLNSIEEGINNTGENGKIKLDSLPLSSKSRIPKFFVKIVELISKHQKSASLYTQPENEDKVKKIKDKIKSHKSYSFSKIKSSPSELCQLLLDFLEEIVEPLLRPEVVEPFLHDFGCVNDQQRQSDIKILMDTLPDIYRETIELLMRHLNNVVECQEQNNLSKERICEIFAPKFFGFASGDVKKYMYEKIFESILTTYVSHSPSLDVSNSSFGSSRSISLRTKEFQFPDSPKSNSSLKFARILDFKRKSKINSVYDNLPEGVYIQNEATFLDDNT